MVSGRGPGQGRGKVIGNENDRKDYLVWTSCINIGKHTLKFSNYVLVRVPINNYNYEQPIALFVVLLW